MSHSAFYDSIDRILPRSFFCLEDKAWNVLMKEYSPSVVDIEEHCCYMPDRYIIVPIRNAIKQVFLSCLDSKYEYALLDRESKYIFCITASLNDFLTLYHQPVYVSDIIYVNQPELYRVFLKESLNLGFLQFKDKTSNNKYDLNINAWTMLFRKKYAEVKLLRHRGSSLCFMIKDSEGQKMFLKQFTHNGMEDKDSFAKKMSLIVKFQDSDFFVKLIHYDIDLMFYTTQYIEGQNLENVYLTMSMDTKINIIYQVVCSIAFLHSRNIVHGDLHLGQFIIMDNGKLKIIDYDMVADITDDNISHYMGATCEYIEPESLSRNPFVLLQKKDLNYKAEVYRLGILIYTIIYGSYPFLELTWEMLYRSKKYNKIRFESIDNNGDLIPQVLISIMKKCLYKCPDKRFTSACEILPYFVNI